MYRSLAIALLGVAIIAYGALGGAELADAAGPSRATKVGYVDLQRTLNETRVGKKAKGRLEREKKKRQRQLDKAQSNLKKFAMELEKQRAVLKPNVLRQREAELQQKYIELQEQFVKLQQELAKEEAQLVQEIFRKAAPEIEKIAKRDGYTIMLEKSESAVLWAHPSTDITDEVNKLLDSGK